ncbi:MAG: helix-turn-helix transcriptional regulator [Chloroflexi bacterium]|nr:helix-turn-helix transcriptional regulator [Chloroflexota bacterium]
MSAPILATKLYIPPPRPGTVSRPRLIEQLNQGLSSGHKLILVSASAGFGKTTLVSEWVASLNSSPLPVGEGQGVRVAWLSLDGSDNDPVRFITYLIEALQTMKTGFGESLLAVLQSRQPPSTEAILTALLNEISTALNEFLFVLDDYHVIDSRSVDEILSFLVEHQPPQMHLVIATREDPSLQLARLRVRGQLTELRSADLRFTPAEAAEFLNQMMGLNLSDADITALEARTEGWIAGLQLAALSMQGRKDIAGFIQAFTGSHRFVLDYLIEEVLQQQPEHIRNFLLQTALLDKLCVSLCNAITERQDGKEMLDVLERTNMFLIPLDDQRQWYRYHHLFAEVLQAYLHEEQPDQVSMLHRRASVWFEQNDLITDAIPHALAAKDFERAANLIERVWLAMDLNYQHVTWLGWAKALPDDLVRAHPVISVGYAWGLLGTGELEASEEHLRDAERWLEPTDLPAEDSASKISPERGQRMIVVDEAEFRSLPASIAAARAYRALALGDISATKMYARQALTHDTENTSPHYTQATALLGIAEYASGDLQMAEQILLKFQAMMWQVNDLASAIGISYVLADIKRVQGRLREAVSAYQQSLQLAASRGAPFFIGVSDLHRGLSEALCEQNDLEAAIHHLLTAQQMGELGATTGWQQRLCVAQARLKESQGDLPHALACLEEAERQYVRNPMPDPPVAALKARIWIRQRRLIEAFSWAREQNLSQEDELSYRREFEHLTLARALIARYKVDKVDDPLHTALGLMERLLQAAEEGGRNGSVLKILILQSLAYQAQDDQSRALVSLERALTLAEPEGYVRIFVDEGKPMADLLGRLIASCKSGRRKTYVHKLLAAFGAGELHPSALILQPLVEPLSERELEVLKLLRSELSGPEIAEQLIVSLNTLRTHTKSIFNKLGVNNRRAAVRRAEELELY